eukprot:m51a1_g4358 hypothetical protein (390) ;mRNA; f:256766-258058
MAASPARPSTAEALSMALVSSRWCDAAALLARCDDGAVDAFAAAYKTTPEALIADRCDSAPVRDLLLAFLRGPVATLAQGIREFSPAGATAAGWSRLVSTLIDAAVLCHRGRRQEFRAQAGFAGLEALTRCIEALAEHDRDASQFCLLVWSLFEGRHVVPEPPATATASAARPSSSSSVTSVESDARRFVAAGGGDAEAAARAFAEMAGRSTPEHLRRVDAGMRARYGQTLLGVVRAETRDRLLRKLLVALAAPRDEYFAAVLRKALKSRGRKEHLVRRVVEANDHVALLEAAAAYTWVYREDPAVLGAKAAACSDAAAVLVALLDPAGHSAEPSATHEMLPFTAPPVPSISPRGVSSSDSDSTDSDQMLQQQQHQQHQHSHDDGPAGI